MSRDTTLANVGTATLTGADAKLVGANASRGALIVSAAGDTWLSYGATPAVVGHGHCVRGGAIPFVEEDWKGEVHAIGTGVVGFTETDLAIGDDQGERTAGADSFTPAGPGDARPVAHPPAPGVPQT